MLRRRKVLQGSAVGPTIKDVRAVLRSALTSAMREEFLARNVAEVVTTPKQRKRKIVPWSSEEARRFLESARADKDVMYAAFVLILVDPRTLNRRFTARCAAAGVRQLTVHDARRTCATLLVDLDVHPRVIMRILRHADQAVSMEIYAKASSKAAQEALRRLGESLR